MQSRRRGRTQLPTWPGGTCSRIPFCKAIREAFKSNYDLQLAVARVEQERALLGVSRSQYYPQVEYDASISGAQSQLVPNHTYYGYSFSTFWEIDLFGRLRKLNEAQRAVYFSSEEARRDVRLLVLSEVAQGYFQLRALDEQLAIAHRTVNSFQVTLELFQHKLDRKSTRLNSSHEWIS